MNELTSCDLAVTITNYETSMSDYVDTYQLQIRSGIELAMLCD